ncbi:guanine nucleotide exchange factor for Rab-3A isoform X5 [Opisthocomus hoazin]|uniref:guanine nucleotide exchange factor for Rab-3A isoform X5 n=1 Tax=Opisthocomus hoazin TaxID=30419 RepID=UPI003F5354F5
MPARSGSSRCSWLAQAGVSLRVRAYGFLSTGPSVLNSSSRASFEEAGQKQPAVGHWRTLMPSKGSKEEPATGCQDAGGVDETQATEQLNVSRLRSSSVEIREKGSEFLKEELHKAQKELKLKDKECERLSKVREQLEQELEELTASLFEEAHKMVREANTKQAASEKQLREARGKIDMLQAEVTALKTLVITSTPSSPNRELHPQLQSPSKAVFRKGHGRNKSTSSAMVSAASQNVTPEPVSRECKESGLPALLSLLLCIIPKKVIRIAYEPGWQAAGADASSSLQQLSPTTRSTPFYLLSSRPGRNLQLWKNPAPSWTEFIKKMSDLVWTSLSRSCRSWYEWLWSRIRSPSSRLLPRHCLW